MKFRGYMKLIGAFGLCIEQEHYVSVAERRAIFLSWEKRYQEKFYLMYIHIVPVTELRAVRKADGMNHGAVDVL